MKATFKPAEKGAPIPLLRPGRRDTVPAIKLFLEDSADPAPQPIKSLVFTLTFRHQVDCWLSPQIRERQMRTGWVHLMQPVQEWLRGHYNKRGSVNEFHGFRNATRPLAVHTSTVKKSAATSSSQ